MRQTEQDVTVQVSYLLWFWPNSSFIRITNFISHRFNLTLSNIGKVLPFLWKLLSTFTQPFPKVKLYLQLWTMSFICDFSQYNIIMESCGSHLQDRQQWSFAFSHILISLGQIPKYLFAPLICLSTKLTESVRSSLELLTLVSSVFDFDTFREKYCVARHSGLCLQFQHAGGWGRRIVVSLRSVWVTYIKGQPEILCLKTPPQKNSIINIINDRKTNVKD